MGSLNWEDLPLTVRTNLRSLSGGEGRFRSVSGGYSGAITGFLGEFLFAKAIPVSDPVSSDFSIEAKVATALKGIVTTPTLCFGGVIDGWSILVFELASGVMPEEPWHPAQLKVVLRSVDAMTAALTPSPVTQLPTVADRMQGRSNTWRLLREGRSRDMLTVRDLSNWEVLNLDRLANLEGQAETLSGETLLHFDLRHDNLLIDDDEVRFLDWGRACIGPAWVDIVCLLLESNTGDSDLEGLFRATSRGAIAAPPQVDVFLVMLASYWRHSALLETDTPGLRQRRQYSLEATLRWLSNRWLA